MSVPTFDVESARWPANECSVARGTWSKNNSRCVWWNAMDLGSGVQNHVTIYVRFLFLFGIKEYRILTLIHKWTDVSEILVFSGLPSLTVS